MSQNSRISKICSLVGVDNEGRTITKSGDVARVIEIFGKDYTGLSEADLQAFYNKRQNLFKKLPTHISLLQQSHRIKEKFNLTTFADNTNKEDILQTVNELWSNNFQVSYTSKHFLIITTKINFLDSFFGKRKNISSEIKEILDKTTKDIVFQFRDYGAKELQGDELFSYYAFLLNGKFQKLKMPKTGIFDDLFFGSDIVFTLKKYQIYDGIDKKFSAWLIIKKPADEGSSDDFFNSLFRIKKIFSIYQLFSSISQGKALRMAEDKSRNARAFMSDAEIISDEIKDLKERVQAGEMSMLLHTWAIEIFGDNREDLENNIREVQEIMEVYGYMFARENINIQALFWSRFPGLQHFNPRVRGITSENAPHFFTFSKIGEGLDKCSWGDKPVTQFKTSAETPHKFVFHVNEEKLALGNTLIVGGAGSGKTTLIEFLLSQCFTNFEGFRALCFDRLRGLEVWTNALDGHYIDERSVLKLGLNPLQLPNTPKNRTFLALWMEMLVHPKEEDKGLIGDVVRRLYKMKKNTRTIDNLVNEFGLGGKGSLREKFGRWTSEGVYGGFFSSISDAMDFSNKLITYDMTSLLENKDVLAPMLFYIFHSLFESLTTKGYAVFVDELNRYIQSPDFAAKIAMLLEEIRKTNGVFIGAIQSATKILNSDISAVFLDNIATYIFFPEPRAVAYNYMEVEDPNGKIRPNFRLNETEFAWIKGNHYRQVLVKKKTGESIILKTDLSALGKYLNFFDSGVDAVRKLKESKKQFGNDWKKSFLH